MVLRLGRPALVMAVSLSLAAGWASCLVAVDYEKGPALPPAGGAGGGDGGGGEAATAGAPAGGAGGHGG